MSYQTEWFKRGIRWEYYGDVTSAEIEAANNAFYADPRSDQSRYQIIDARQVSSVKWSDFEISKTAAFDRGAEASIQKVKVAYVAEDDEIMDLLDQYAELSRGLNSSWQFRGFRDLDSAMKWAAE